MVQPVSSRNSVRCGNIFVISVWWKLPKKLKISRKKWNIFTLELVGFFSSPKREFFVTGTLNCRKGVRWTFIRLKWLEDLNWNMDTVGAARMVEARHRRQTEKGPSRRRRRRRMWSEQPAMLSNAQARSWGERRRPKNIFEKASTICRLFLLTSISKLFADCLGIGVVSASVTNSSTGRQQWRRRPNPDRRTSRK